MNWILISLVSAFFAAVINHTDKYLLTRYLKGGGIGALVIFSSLMGFPVALLIFLFVPSVLDHSNYLPIILNGALYIGWLLPYFYALESDEASVVAPLFQLSPIASLIFGWLLLGEAFSIQQFFGAVLILVGTFGLTLELGDGVDRKTTVKFKILGLMLLASVLVSLNGVLFKVFALDADFLTTSFWEYVGFGITGLLLLTFVKLYRKQFFEILSLNSKQVIGLNIANEVNAMMAKIAINYASLLFLVAAVFFVAEGFQPFFVVAIGVVLTIFFPKISQERIERKYLVQKIISILIMLLGTGVLYFG